MNSSLRRAFIAAAFAASVASVSAQTAPRPTIPSASPAPGSARPNVPPAAAPEKPIGKKEAAADGVLPPVAAKASATPEPVPKSPKAIIDGLSDADLGQVIQLLKAHYVTQSSLSDIEVRRATVQGLLERLGAGAKLLSKPVAAPEEIPFHSETIDNRIGYLKMGTIKRERLPELDAALKEITEQSREAVVLDLRATPDGTDLDLAAEVCRRFCPKGKVMFTIRRPNARDQIIASKDEPQYHGLLAVLTDEANAGNAEIIAGVLQSLAGGMVIGGSTAGAAAEYTDLPLSGKELLRIAVAEVILPGGVTPMSKGIKPDLEVEVAPATTKKVLAEEAEKGLTPLILETERSRMNEAALVAGTNPDLEAMIAAQKNHTEKTKPPLHDATLQRAVDFITSVAVYERGLKEK